MKEENNDIAIKVNHVYKSFNVYYDRANTLKERLLFIGRNKKREKENIEAYRKQYTIMDSNKKQIE